MAPAAPAPSRPRRSFSQAPAAWYPFLQYVIPDRAIEIYDYHDVVLIPLTLESRSRTVERKHLSPHGVDSSNNPRTPPAALARMIAYCYGNVGLNRRQTCSQALRNLYSKVELTSRVCFFPRKPPPGCALGAGPPPGGADGSRPSLLRREPAQQVRVQVPVTVSASVSASVSSSTSTSISVSTSAIASIGVITVAVSCRCICDGTTVPVAAIAQHSTASVWSCRLRRRRQRQQAAVLSPPRLDL